MTRKNDTSEWRNNGWLAVRPKMAITGIFAFYNGIRRNGCPPVMLGCGICALCNHNHSLSRRHIRFVLLVLMSHSWLQCTTKDYELYTILRRAPGIAKSMRR